MSTARRLAVGAAAALLAFVPLAARPADPLEIDVILPLTGPNAALGEGIAHAVAAVEQATNKSGGIAGRPLHFAVHDDTGNVQLDLQLANAAIAKKPAVVMGPAIVAGCRAIAPLLKDGPVLYCLSPALHPERGSYAFSSNSSTDDALAVLVRYLVARGVKRVGVLTTTDATGQDADAAIDQALAAAKAADLVVAREHFNATDLSVSAQLARMKIAKPEWVIVWTTGTALGTALRGMKDAGFDADVITGNGNSNREMMGRFADVMPKELVFPANPSQLAPDRIDDPATRRAVQTYLANLAAVGVAKPDESHGGSYDPFVLIVDALRKLGPEAGASQLRDYLASLRGFVGVQGAYDFPAAPQRGITQGSVVITRWDPKASAWIPLSKLGGAPLR